MTERIKGGGFYHGGTESTESRFRHDLQIESIDE
jgi:hypothetical protein